MSKHDLTRPCPRCLVGIDDDGDGNCGICARWPEEEARRVRFHATRNAKLQAADAAVPHEADLICFECDHRFAAEPNTPCPKCGGASEPVPEKPVARSADTYPNQYVDLSDPVAVRARTLKGLSGGDV